MTAPGTEASDHVTPFDRLAIGDVAVEQMILSGDHRRELSAYFGESEYLELVTLARRAHAVPLPTDAVRVILVPGIMGSQLGVRRRAPLPDDMLWLDPLDVRLGRLAHLRLDADGATAPKEAQPAVVPMGVVLYSYLRLRLHLRGAGIDSAFHAYDWRLDVEDLGRELAARLAAESAPRLALLGHSMGALVGRAALAQPGMDRVERFVMLGAPCRGSYAPVQALRGTYAVVRKIARLDLRHSAETLARDVFNTFPSLYQLLPRASEDTQALDLFDARSWPSDGPPLLPELLARARALDALLAPPDTRHCVVVGVGQETVTGVERVGGGEFVYTITRRGDGTVPAASAMLEGADHYFTTVAHSELTRDAQVALAVADLLHSGETRRLPRRWRTRAHAEARISDSQLRATHLQKVDWTSLEPDARRVFLQTLNEPPHLRLRVP